jgi:phospholipase D1/2
LLRGEELEEALNKGSYSPYIGELFKQKADEGVTVNMLVWDDATSNPNLLRPVGFMGTHDEQSKAFFEGSRVNFRLAPMQGDEDDSMSCPLIIRSLWFLMLRAKTMSNGNH